MYGCESSTIKKAETKDLMLLNSAVGEDSWVSLELQRDHTSQSWSKSTLNTHWKDWSWRWSSNTLATWCEELSHWKRPWWRQEEKGMTEDEMVGWHHWLDGHKFEQVLGVGDGEGGLVCCSPWGYKESDRVSDWTESKGCWLHSRGISISFQGLKVIGCIFTVS